MIFDPVKPQRIALKHLALHKEVLLFMGMGLGKTATCLEALRRLFEDGAVYGALVIAPLRVCNLVWRQEADKWTQFRDFRVANLRTEEGFQALLKGEAHIYLINYERLPKLREHYFKGRKELGFDVVIWDETTKAKNHNSTRVNSVRHYLRKKCERHWGLTGTPQPNSLLDLFAQVRLIDGGKTFGPSFSKFRETYFNPIDYDRRQWEPKHDAKARIYKRLAPLTVTLRSSDWLKIPNVQEEDIDILLPNVAKKHYFELEREFYTEIDQYGVEAPNAAVLVGKLLQVTSGALYRTSEEGVRSVLFIHNLKLRALEKLYKKLWKQKRALIVACQFQHEQARLREMFPHATFFQDARSHPQQEALQDRWNNREISMLVVHPDSMGHGLNLQKGGSDICWLSLPWSNELYDQLNCRLARRGQEEVTNIYRIMCPGTADDAVAIALRSKDREQAALIQAMIDLRETL